MARIIVVTSGKGGVGKTTSSAAIATGLAQKGKKTVVIDFDIGLRNLDLIMGCERRVVYDFVNVIQGDATLNQALIKDKRTENLYILPASQTRDKDALTREGVEKFSTISARWILTSWCAILGRYRNRCADGAVLRRRSYHHHQPGSVFGTRLRPYPRASSLPSHAAPRKANRQSRNTCC